MIPYKQATARSQTQNPWHKPPVFLPLSNQAPSGLLDRIGSDPALDEPETVVDHPDVELTFVQRPNFFLFLDTNFSVLSAGGINEMGRVANVGMVCGVMYHLARDVRAASKTPHEVPKLPQALAGTLAAAGKELSQAQLLLIPTLGARLVARF